MAKGVIEELTFPSSAEIDVQSNWSLVVHNIGTEGRFAAIIVNASGNPGDIKVTWEGKEWILPPTNRGLRIFSSSPEPNCMRIRANGQIAFTVEGSYNIRVLAQHEGAPDVWLSDEEQIITVNVAEVTPPEWPIVKTEQVFDNERLAPGLFIEATKQREKPVDTSHVLGGRIEYSVKLESSILTGCTFYVLWNNEVMDMKGFLITDPHGMIKTGIIDIPLSKIRSINVLGIALTHVPVTNNVVLANVYVTLGYSSDPTVDPPWEVNWWELLKKYGPWIALGVTGLAVLPFLIFRPPLQRGRN